MQKLILKEKVTKTIVLSSAKQVLADLSYSALF